MAHIIHATTKVRKGFKMTKEIIQYPTPLSVEFGVNVRQFNEELFALIEDLKDTINENNLKALSAFQIGNYNNVIVVKNEDGSYLELINPSLIAHSGKITKEEKTAYYNGLTAEITRFENVSLVYQDIDAKNCSLRAEGDLAILLQRKLDYLFGATFIQKMSSDERDKFELKLEYGTNIGMQDYCPTTFFRDKILKAINILMFLMLGVAVGSFFIEENDILEKVWQYQTYGFVAVLLLHMFYFFYAQYEGKKYVACASCQIGNILGTVLISLIKFALLFVVSYIIISPA